MIVAILTSLVGLAIVLVAYYADEPIADRGVIRPSWGVQPDPGEVARTVFPLAYPGYDPATVEVHFDALNRAYADLFETASPEVRSRARQRAALRHGVDVDDVPSHRAAQTGPASPSTRAPAPNRGAADEEALRAEAALADLENPKPDA